MADSFRYDDPDNGAMKLRARYGFRFVPEITLGNVVSVFLVVTGMLTWGLRLEGRVDTEAKLRDDQHFEMVRRLDYSDGQHRDDLLRIESSLGRIEAKIDGKVDKAK